MRVKARVICVGESKLVVGRELTEVGRVREKKIERCTCRPHHPSVTRTTRARL